MTQELRSDMNRGPGRPPKSRATIAASLAVQRRCLKCGREFAHPVNRVCDVCHAENAQLGRLAARKFRVSPSMNKE